MRTHPTHRFVGVLLVLLLACGDDDDPAGSAAGSGGGSGSGSAHDAAIQHDAGARDAGAPPAQRCDVVPPTKCVEPAPTFADVQPIIEDRCLSCHDGKGEQWPLTSYSHVASWSIQIRDAMIRCAMPPADAGITMPTAEREQLLHWIRCGFPP
jgi:hypothetical protein